MYNPQDGQARVPSHPLASAAPQKSPPGGKEQTTKTLNDQRSGCAYSRRSLCDHRLLLTSLRAVASCMSSTKTCRHIIPQLNPDSWNGLIQKLPVCKLLQLHRACKQAPGSIVSSKSEQHASPFPFQSEVLSQDYHSISSS